MAIFNSYVKLPEGNLDNHVRIKWFMDLVGGFKHDFYFP